MRAWTNRRGRVAMASAMISLSAVLLSACQSMTQPEITKTEDAELSGDVEAYHRCVAHTAALIDDGHSPISEVSGAAMDHCLPQALEVSKLLDSAGLPDGFKAKYLEKLLAVASRQSAVMLRRRRNPDWDQSVI
jgi:hypothetical protein